MSRPRSEGFIYVKDITFILRWESSKTFDHIVLRSGSFEKEISTRISHENTHKEVFDPPLELSVQDGLSLSMRYPIIFRRHKLLSIDVGLTEAAEALDDVNGNKTYTKAHKDIEVIIGISSPSAASTSPHDEPSPVINSETPDVSDDPTLLSTTAEIIRICPRFRLLIIGNSGVGKSTLIQKVFGVKDVDISEYMRGRANIDQEFVAKENGLFVLHDSLGLEAGDSKNMEEIRRFIRERRSKEKLRDRLHAVWVCLAIPYAKGRLLETGMEEFLRDRKKILGDIPVVVVLTKLDLLDVSLRSRGVMKSLVEAKTKFLEEYCANPLIRAGAGEIPQVPVSTKGGFGLESTVSDLVKTTTSEIERYVRTDPSSYAVTATMAKRSSLERDAPIFIAGMAQRASIEEKVNLTITLGKTRYWKNLSASLRFSSKKVEEYILVIHKEIIDIWNFNDPEMALRADDFKTKLLDTPNLGVQDIRSLKVVLASLTSLATLLVPQMATMPHAIVFVAPVAGVVALGTVCLEISRAAKTIVRRFMAYIADLVYVMKILFILVPLRPITPQDVDFALEAYKKSPYRNCVHLLIKEFDVDLTVLGNSHMVMQKIEDVIRKFSITDKEVPELRRKVEAAQGSVANAK